MPKWPDSSGPVRKLLGTVAIMGFPKDGRT
jgi:hypothetical protein